jgi:hypothetical protein
VSNVDVLPPFDGLDTGFDLSRGVLGIVVGDRDQRDVVGEVGE